MHEQRCHHAAEEQAQRTEEQTVHRGGGAMTGETQATVSLFKTIVEAAYWLCRRGWPLAAHGRAAGLIDSRAARRRVGLHVLVGRAERRQDASKTFSELWSAAFGRETSWIIDLIIVGVAGGAALTAVLCAASTQVAMA